MNIPYGAKLHGTRTKKLFAMLQREKMSYSQDLNLFLVTLMVTDGFPVFNGNFKEIFIFEETKTYLRNIIGQCTLNSLSVSSTGRDLIKNCSNFNEKL